MPIKAAPTKLLLSARVGLGVVLICVTACDRSMTRDVQDDAKLTSRAQEIVRPGSDSAAARRVLEVQGFACGTRTGSQVDTLEKTLEPRVSCQKAIKPKSPIGAPSRHFLVDVLLEGANVRGIEARTWIDSVP